MAGLGELLEEPMSTDRPTMHLPGHPLAPPSGRVRVSRVVLYDKLDGQAGDCHWCGDALTWETLCADHLNGTTNDNRPENLVGSCRGCNANRSDGTGHGRREPKLCEWCGAPFLKLGRGSHHGTARFCSASCANSATAKRGPRSPHGTRTRYVSHKCRCVECRAANTAYTRKLKEEGRLSRGY